MYWNYVECNVGITGPGGVMRLVVWSVTLIQEHAAHVSESKVADCHLQVVGTTDCGCPGCGYSGCFLSHFR
jgi:hypothetical protein